MAYPSINKQSYQREKVIRVSGYQALDIRVLGCQVKKFSSWYPNLLLNPACRQAGAPWSSNFLIS
jgi:hypothetical protein